MGKTHLELTRRAALGAAALIFPSPILAADQGYNAAGRRIAAMETARGLRIGLAAMDTGNGNCIFYRESKRFLMCSTFKVMLVAATLARVDAGGERLDRVIHYRQSDLLSYAPETKKNLAQGMSVGALCRSAILYSDNTAANLLFAGVGGPAGVTRFARGLGDSLTRFDRMEDALNVPDGDRDTTTPTAMVADLKGILLGDALKPASRQQLSDWMQACATGLTRLRAGLPKSWKVGDKTGSGGGGALNDIAIAWPPANRAPVLICAYTTGNKPGDAADDRTLADIGALIGERFI